MEEKEIGARSGKGRLALVRVSLKGQCPQMFDHFLGKIRPRPHMNEQAKMVSQC